MEIADLSLSGILDALTTMAWSKPCHDPEGNFLLSPLGLARDSSPEGLWQTLHQIYEHARNWAPGLDVPWFVPPVRFADLASTAGHFRVDEESYASIALSTEFLGSKDATLLILVHEACYHILLQSGISYRYKNDAILNERITDLAMFVCGFGEIVRGGHSVVRRCRGQYLSVHLGYFGTDEYERAHRYVLARRAADHLPGGPELTAANEPELIRFVRDMTLRWPCRRGDFILWFGYRDMILEPESIQCCDLWEMRDGYRITITNRIEDLPPWFELHPTEVCGVLAWKMMAKIEKGYKPRERMDGPNIWRLKPGDRVAWVGAERPECRSVNGILAILDCDECALAIGEGNWGALDEFFGFGAQTTPGMSPEDVARCQAALEGAKQLGVPRNWGPDWILG